MLIRFWIEFERENNSVLPYGLGYGCGVTAINFDDAINIIKNKMFDKDSIPEIKNKIENIDVNSLDSGHVLLNMHSPDRRGIWFPIGFHDNY